MNKTVAIQRLRTWDRRGKYVFSTHALQKMFVEDPPKTFRAGLARLVKDQLLIRAYRGVYVNPHALSADGYTVEHIAKALRPGAYNYVSLESILSEYGVISQIPIDRLTVMTTGREGLYKTAFGVIEYTHTKRSMADILNSMRQVVGRPLRIASKQAAWRDLKRVGRNTDLADSEELHE